MSGALPSDLPVVDHHVHLAASGEGVAAVRRFAAAGGTHLFLTTQDYERRPPLSRDDYVAQYDETERLARVAQSEAGVTVYVVLAPYPVDLAAQSEHLGLEAAVALQRDALELAGARVAEQRAVALGEVGRCHFPVAEPVAQAGGDVFRHALEVARDVGCPAVVHSEDLDAAGYEGLAALAAQVGLPPSHVVKHYDRAGTPAAARAGVTASYLARREVVAKVRTEPGPWFLETDFLDDPARPGAVLDVTTVPRRAVAIAGQGAEAIERLRVPFVDSLREVYGLVPSVARAGSR